MSGQPFRNETELLAYLLKTVKKLETAGVESEVKTTAASSSGAGGLIDDAAYIIRINGSRVEAVNGETGVVEFSYG